MKTLMFVLAGVIFSPDGDMKVRPLTEPITRTECKEKWKQHVDYYVENGDSLELLPGIHITAFCVPENVTPVFTKDPPSD